MIRSQEQLILNDPDFNIVSTRVRMQQEAMEKMHEEMRASILAAMRAAAKKQRNVLKLTKAD